MEGIWRGREGVRWKGCRRGGCVGGVWGCGVCEMVW